MGHLQGSRVKIRVYMIAHKTPLSPRTTSFAAANQVATPTRVTNERTAYNWVDLPRVSSVQFYVL